MTLSRMTVAVGALFFLSACAASPAGDSEPGTATAETSPAAASFASYIQGEWSCEKPPYSGAEVRFPAFGMGDLKSSEISIGDGTWSASWSDDPDDKAEGTWKIEGREISLTSPLGTQVIGNLPETPEQAMEPMRLKIASSDSNVTIQVRGERTMDIATPGNKYATECVKY